MSVIRNDQLLFKLLWHSDEHTIHPHTPTHHILTNIDRMREKVGIDEIDIEIWGGDLCENSTHTSDHDYIYLQKWVKRYLDSCHQKKKLVRILAGTASHDWEQPGMFELLKPTNSPYIKYIDTLSIEYIKEFDINVMYVPDNFGNKPKIDIFNDAVKLLEEHQLTQVDFIFLHGIFDFQMPLIGILKGNGFDSEAWSALASKIILSGDVHTPSSKHNIYCSGSFDRLRHGEMHPKGAYEVLFNESSCIPTFIENKHAMIYDTIELLPKTTAKQLVGILDDYLDNINMKGAHIRLMGGEPGIVNPILEEYKQMYPQYNFTAAFKSVKGASFEEALYLPDMDTTFKITKNNIQDSYFQYLGDNIPDDIEPDYLISLLTKAIEKHG